MIIDRDNTVYDNLNSIRLRVVGWGHARSGSEWIGSINSPSYTRLYYILGGSPYIVADGRRLELELGHCYLLPVGFSFSYACEGSMEQLYFHINLLDRNGTDLLRAFKEPIGYRLPDGKPEELLGLISRDDPIGCMLLRQELYASLLRAISESGIHLESVRYSRCVQLAIEYIRRHLSMQLGISELAANSFVSVSTLSKKFRAEVGMTIGDYIDDAILFEAEQLLCNTELSVLQISERFGYCDQFYFSRRFKRKFGETPQKYRKQRPI